MFRFGLIQGFVARDVRVPEDVSVISFDNIVFAEQFTPRLTTIDYPTRKIGRLAAHLLIDQMKNNESRPMSIKMEPRLVRRDTVRSLTSSGLGSTQ